MSRETRCSARLSLHPIVLGIVLFFVLSIIAPTALFAQSPVGETVGVPKLGPNRLAADVIAAVTTDYRDTGETSGAVAGQLGVKPPLPFVSPQVGPFIKRAYQDDVDRRTTAFLPQSLDNLTPIKMPNEARWIRADLSEQIVVAYEGKKPVRAFIVSSGLPGTPTVTGEFRIRTKVVEQVMSGGVGSGYYYLPGVKWVQYFYQDYSFHGTYWHNNFGNPMSHGCLNMTNADAKWLFDWAGPTWDGKSTWYKSNEDNPGTLVIITE